MKKSENPLYLKFKQQGWTSIGTFLKETKVPVSAEAARMAIYLGKKISIPVLILLCKYLGFNINEIKKILIDAGDTEFVELMGGYMTPDEKAVLGMYEKIEDKQKVFDYIELIAKAEGKNVKKELDYLKRRA